VDLFAIRHGKIEWSLIGRHTGRTDTFDGKRLPPLRAAWAALIGARFALVLTSPPRRVRDTCRASVADGSTTTIGTRFRSGQPTGHGKAPPT
jgi:phosphohistidine phosphatase SixA